MLQLIILLLLLLILTNFSQHGGVYSEYYKRQNRRQEGETHWPLWSHMVYICKTILYATWHEDVGCLMIERRIYKHTHNRSGRFIIIIYSSITHVGWLSTKIHRNNCAETDVRVSRSRMKKYFFFLNLNLNTTKQVPMYIMPVLLLLPISYQIPVYNDEPHITLYIYT